MNPSTERRTKMENCENRFKEETFKECISAEDIDLIEDCLRTALGDSRQATRILNVRRQN